MRQTGADKAIKDIRRATRRCAETRTEMCKKNIRSIELMRTLVLFIIAIELAVLHSNAALANDDSTTLSCYGTRATKHYNSEEKAQFVAEIKNSEITFSETQQVISYGLDGKINESGSQQKIKKIKFRITDQDNNFYAIKLDGSVNGDARIMNLDKKTGKPYTVEINKDDFASGSINRLTGLAIIQTRYFSKQNSDSEYGWKWELSCQKVDRAF